MTASRAERCIIFTANRGYALRSSRCSLIRKFAEADWNVVLATADDQDSRSLCDLGARLESVAFRRGGIALKSDISAYRRLRQIYRKYQPTLIQQFHAKPAIFGSLAARRALEDAVRVVNTITGLGQAFVQGGLSSRLAGLGYRSASRKTDITVFQNRDDHRFFLEQGWVNESNSRVILSSGVDLGYFEEVDRNWGPRDELVVLMLGRLLRQKGVPEFVEVASRIRRLVPQARFVVAGEEDMGHPDAVSREWLDSRDDVEYLGRLADVRPALAKADLLLFPSYYREGVPRVILEASATGLPVVAYDVPGVRDVVGDGETGFLVPEGNVEALARGVRTLLEDETLRRKMGRAARSLMERSFDVRDVTQQYLDVYRDLGVVNF